MAVDPTLLPVATTQALLTSAYNALGVPSLAAGATYLDPTTGVKIYKLTSATFPASAGGWGHDYSEGGNEISLPYNGSTRAVLARNNDNATWRLFDFTPGVGVGNSRALTGNLGPGVDGAFTFSNNPATPYYAYVAANDNTIRRFDIRTMAEAPGSGWPVTDGAPNQLIWLHQAENDSFFVWMRGSSGSTVVGYEPSTTTLKTHTDANLNEPRIDRQGRYVAISMNIPNNGLKVWDWLTNTITWTTGGDPGTPFAHNASLRRRFIVANWNLSSPCLYGKCDPSVNNSLADISGSGPISFNGGMYMSGNWINIPGSGNPDDQWWLTYAYGTIDPGAIWLAHGGLVYATANGQRRLIGHFYSNQATYFANAWAKSSPDGAYVLFTSDMVVSGRFDLFAAEMPTSGTAGAFTKLQVLMPGETADPGSATGKTGSPSAQTAGTAFNVIVNAVDATWNVVNTITDVVGITSSDSNATLPANAALVAGTKIFSVTLKTAGAKTVTSSDITDATKTANTSPSITVNAGVFAKLQILVPGETAAPGSGSGKTGTPIAQTAGTPFTVVVNGVDANWNLKNAVTDVAGITSSDGGATLPANAALVAGTKNFSVTLNTAGTKTVTATDITDGTKTANTSASITVSASSSRPGALTLAIT